MPPLLSALTQISSVFLALAPLGPANRSLHYILLLKLIGSDRALETWTTTHIASDHTRQLFPGLLAHQAVHRPKARTQCDRTPEHRINQPHSHSTNSSNESLHIKANHIKPPSQARVTYNKTVLQHHKLPHTHILMHALVIFQNTLPVRRRFDAAFGDVGRELLDGTRAAGYCWHCCSKLGDGALWRTRYAEGASFCSQQNPGER